MDVKKDKALRYLVCDIVKIQCTQTTKLLEKLYGCEIQVNFLSSFFLSFFLSFSKVTIVHYCVTKTFCCVTFS